ncbi:MAG: hypothetical protein CMI29_07865 [Opitutae bacterium]|nr:hypothetical protein [Opitutae bacterium]
MSNLLEKFPCANFAFKTSFVFICTNLLLGPHVLVADSTTVWWQSWKKVYSGYPFDTPGTTPTNVQELRGRDLTGTARDLYQGSDGQSLDGDLVELGYYKLSDNTANTSNTNLFQGTWTPLTTKTTIGHNYYLDGSNNSGSTAGQFHFSTKFSASSGSDTTDDTANTNHELNNAYEISNDTFSSLSDEVTRLEAGNDAGGTNHARLGIRFYETGTRSNASVGGLTKDDTVGHVLYNTVMAETWRWVDTDTGGLGDQHLHIQLHDPTSNSAMTSGLAFEFDNNSHNAYSKVGSSSGAVGTDNYVTSLTYHDGDDSIDLDTVGSANFSGLSGTGNITDTENAVFRTVTLHTAAGNMGNDGTSFAGGISGDITLIKTGGTAGNGTNDGEQTLSGTIAITDTSGSDGEGYLDIKGGTLILAPNGSSQSFEYIKGAGNLDLVNSGGQTVELGFTTATSAQTFSGTVALSGTGAATTVKVSSGTAAGDYNDEQVFSGQVTGSETLTKSGVGRLKLSNSGNNFTNTGGNDVIINDGTLVAAHANALGGASNTVVINKGKLDLEGGISLANTSIQGSVSGKSMVGGDGTFAAITVGDGTNDIKAISPGRGISSSLSPSNHQVTLGTGGAVANAMGDLTVTTLVFNDNAVFDWEITDFNSGANQNSFNDEFDVLNFGTLAFGSNAVVDLNIFSVDSNGDAGAVANLGVHDHTTNDGILFLNGGSHGSITNWGGTTLASGSWSDASSHFNVNDHAYKFHNGNLSGHSGWGVWYNGSGDFYLRYSAVPEPSTYVMVTGLLLLPGFRLVRRFRKSFGKSDMDENSSSS